MAGNTLKKFAVTFKISKKGKKTKMHKEKTESYVLNGFGKSISRGWERKLIDFAQTDFGRVLENITSVARVNINNW